MKKLISDGTMNDWRITQYPWIKQGQGVRHKRTGFKFTVDSARVHFGMVQITVKERHGYFIPGELEPVS